VSSSALRWETKAPGARVYLSTGQRATLTIVRALAARGSTFTTRQMAIWTDAWTTSADGIRTPNGGLVDNRLARLRQLGLIGYAAVRGRRGHVRAWVGPDLRAGVATLAFRRADAHRHAGNDSTSPYGGFLTWARWAESSSKRRERRQPPGSAGRRRLTGPHRGRPPRVVWERCPGGHRIAIGRTSLRRDLAGRIGADYLGHCRRCRSDVRIRHELEIPILARPRSPEELADPGRFEERRRRALELLADPATSSSMREQLSRDYLAPPAAAERDVASAEEILRRLRERGPP
jgi:hypothetical protein